MIVDKIENIEVYRPLSKGFENAFDLLSDLSSGKPSSFFCMNPVKHFVDGEKLFYTVNNYFTHDVYGSEFEAHKKYIDIHYIFSGVETIGVAPTRELIISKEYSPEEDFMKFRNPKDFSKIRLSERMFAIFYPSDAHNPGLHPNGISRIGKIVIKSKINGVMKK